MLIESDPLIPQKETKGWFSGLTHSSGSHPLHWEAVNWQTAEFVLGE